MPRYEVYVHVDVLDALFKTGIHRRRIMHFIDRLRANPDMPGNYADKNTARERQVKIIRGWAITYWPDHAARTVMIVT